MPERLPYIDNLKGLLILLVVIGHLCEYGDVSSCNAAVAMSNFIYTFHMPLFLFCSGLFVSRSYERGSWSGQIATALTFIVIYMLFRVVGYMVSVGLGGAPVLTLFT